MTYFKVDNAPYSCYFYHLREGSLSLLHDTYLEHLLGKRAKKISTKSNMYKMLTFKDL